MSRRPNILLFFTDDQRFDTIHALGNSQIHTPHLDALAARGTSFTRAHIPGGTCGAVCMPSRAMLHSGRILFHLAGVGKTIPAEHVTLGECLQSAGYETFGTGKWHNGREAFARSFSAGDEICFGGMGDHSFFMYVSLMAPHDPRTMPERFRRMYDPDSIELPENFASEHPIDTGALRIRDEMLAAFPRQPDEIRRHIAEYYAMITHLDDALGRLLAALEKSGEFDNTMIVFAGGAGRPELYLAYGKSIRGVSDGHHKLIEYACGATQLFDLERDPREMVNLAAGSENADRQAKLRQTLLNLAQAWDDRDHPLGGEFWNSRGDLWPG